MIDDYFVLRAFYRRHRPLRRLATVVLVLLFIGGLIYAAAFLLAALERTQ
jgi:hypothetical protein